jgi:hypothetical protein
MYIQSTPCSCRYFNASETIQHLNRSEPPPISLFLLVIHDYFLTSISLWLYSPLLDLGRFFIFLILYTLGRTPWTGDQPVARPLSTHRTTQTQNKRTHTYTQTHTHTHRHALSGIRTHGPSVRASEDSSCLRPRCDCDRHFLTSL